MPSEEDGQTFSVNFASGEVFKVGLPVTSPPPAAYPGASEPHKGAPGVGGQAASLRSPPEPGGADHEGPGGGQGEAPHSSGGQVRHCSGFSLDIWPPPGHT